MNYLVYADGSCKNNGRRNAKARGSFALFKLDKPGLVDANLHNYLIKEPPVHHESLFDLVFPEKVVPTNNLAEYRSLFIALSWLFNMQYFKPENTFFICMDSELVLSQLSGLYRVRDPHILKVLQDIYALFDRISKKENFDVTKHLYYRWVSGDVMKASVIGH